MPKKVTLPTEPPQERSQRSHKPASKVIDPSNIGELQLSSHILAHDAAVKSSTHRPTPAPRSRGVSRALSTETHIGGSIPNSPLTTVISSDDDDEVVAGDSGNVGSGDMEGQFIEYAKVSLDLTFMLSRPFGTAGSRGSRN